MKPLIQTASGNIVNFADPSLSTFTLEDIAHGLSMTCRYGGQSKFFYSVAQHAVLVSYLSTDSMAGLHHDDTEAFMCDVPTPLKQLLPEYTRIEKEMHDAIFTALRLPLELSPDVKYADWVALALEKPIVLSEVDSIGWNLPDVSHPSYGDFEAFIKPMSNAEAKELWLARHTELVYNDEHTKTKPKPKGTLSLL